MKRKIPLLLAAVLIFTATATRPAVAQDFNDEELIPKMILHVYDVSGIVTGSLPDYPARKTSDIDGKDVIFPNVRPETLPYNQGNINTGFDSMQNGSINGSQGFFCQGPGEKTYRHPMAICMDTLHDLITVIVEPENWNTVGGPSSIAPTSNGMLVISCTESMHVKIKNLLDMLKKATDDRKNITVEVDLVELPREQIELLLAKSDSEPAVFGLVDPEAWKTVQPVYNSTLTSSNRQTVSTVSGNQRKAVVTAVPVVGDYVDDAENQILAQAPNEPIDPSSLPSGDPIVDPVDESAPEAPEPVDTYEPFTSNSSQRSVGYQPVVSVIQTGVAIETTPILAQDAKTVLLDIRARQIEDSSPVAAPSITPVPPNCPVQFDRPKLANWHLATTVQLPVGKRVLVGGMDSLYLFVKVTAR